MRYFVYRRKSGGASITVSLSKMEVEDLRSRRFDSTKTLLLAQDLLSRLKGVVRLNKPPKPRE